MNTFWQRALVSIASTTILHASIFYSLSSVNQPQIVTQKAVEISLIDNAEIEKKEEPKPKKEPKPTIKPKPIEKEEPKIKPKPTIKPKPIVKKEPKIEPKPVVKEIPIIEQEPIVEKKPLIYKEAPKIVQNEINTEIKETLVSQETREKQEMKSKVSEDKLALYLSKVRAKIQENLRYPPLAKRLKIEGESVVGFEILPDGSVRESSIGIKNSSGHKSLDRQAISTILSVSPFDAPPQNNMSIVLPVAFKLNL
ncbi:energy transducer TonB [Sulfurimonas crateris]|uniref:Energy transducer TonB n=1 Tax=Sulfurimonas crateris TaxID=2574727 RepID=A0A4U2Z647_9BACT|nr:TonB family protein [Sulfurimonas crateris]TKI69325.1 energy transducer TonB [Sulfurimonas crateris]